MKIVVVGAGTAGISTVATLLFNNYKNIVWIDPYFSGGALNYYSGIPSNTKAKNLSKFTKLLSLYKPYTNLDNDVDVFKTIDPEKQTTLDLIKISLDKMLKIIKQDFHQNVIFLQCLMTKIVQIEDATFEIFTNHLETRNICCDKLFLCLGGELKHVSLRSDLNRLNPFEIMSQTKIQLYDLSNDVIQVHGSSHSAVLCLRNLVKMQKPPTKIYHIMNKKQLLYAQYMQDFIRHDTTGLKGVASQFGKKYQNKQFPNIQTQFTWQYKTNKDSTQLVQAIGFNPKSFSFISKQGIQDYQTRQGFLFVNNSKIPNLHLIGLISPQYIVDKEGERMPGIGVDDFVIYLNQLIKQL